LWASTRRCSCCRRAQRPLVFRSSSVVVCTNNPNPQFRSSDGDLMSPRLKTSMRKKRLIRTRAEIHGFTHLEHFELVLLNDDTHHMHFNSVYNVSEQHVGEGVVTNVWTLYRREKRRARILQRKLRYAWRYAQKVDCFKSACEL
jgi:hypothetical protein